MSSTLPLRSPRILQSPRKAALTGPLRYARRDPLGAFSVVVIFVFVIVALFAPWIAPYPAQGEGRSNLDTRLLAPSNAHYMGTDYLGRDVLSRIMYGARNALAVSLAVTLAAAAFGALIGGFAGFVGGWVDEIIMRITDLFLAFPTLLLAMAIVAAIGPSFENVAIALAVRWWTWYARIVRSVAQSLRERSFVEAAQAIGVPTRTIVLRHILPNAASPIIVNATIDFGAVMLVAGGLAFLGLGAQPPTADWGLMIAEGRDYILTQPWLPIFPGLAMFVTVLAFNLLGDSLSRRLDPRRTDR
jgi:peptide/nickel transport system permease protein